MYAFSYEMQTLENLKLMPCTGSMPAVGVSILITSISLSKLSPIAEVYIKYGTYLQAFASYALQDNAEVFQTSKKNIFESFSHQFLLPEQSLV